MNYTYMQTFYVVAKHGNISKAAKELNVTQPAVSRIIANLESEYGTKLFYRSKNGVTLSKEGLNLFEIIKKPYAELERMEPDIANKTAMHGRIVHIGTTVTALYAYLFQRLNDIKKQFPGVNFRLYTGSSKAMLEMVKEGKIDFAFITTPFTLVEDIETITVMDLHDILVAPSSMAERFEGPVSLKKLAKEPFILLNKEMQFREHIDAFLFQHGIKIQPVYELDNSSSILPLVESGFGLAFIPYELAEHSIKEGKCKKIDILEQIPIRHISFAVKSDPNQSNLIYDIQKAIAA